MQITKDQLIAGQPALRVRSFVRTYRILSFSTSEFEKVLNLSPREALNFAHEMVNLGFLTPSTNRSLDGKAVYQVGDQGHMLAIASAAKPISRKTANRVLREFIERVELVNASNEYAYRVESVVLFGSILSDKERLGDVDVAIELQAATRDLEEFQKRLGDRWSAALESDRSFSSNFELLAWPDIEVRRFLKSRSRSLSLHRLSDLMGMNGGECRILLGDTDRVTKMLRGEDHSWIL
jgi:predicted nucleotidyltransferase